MMQERLERLLLDVGVLKSNVNKFTPILIKYFDEYKFNEENIIRFLANVMHESGFFSKLRESLYYTTESRLRQVYPSAFQSKYKPSDYLRNSKKLANLVMDSRIFPAKKSLQNNFDGDGYFFRGGGLLQTTGRYNYKVLSSITKIDFLSNPSLIEDPEMAVKSAIIFWNYNNLSAKANIEQVRISIAGSKQGMTEVKDTYVKMKIILSKMQYVDIIN